MKTDYFRTFLRGILLLQIFFLVIIAGVSVNISWYSPLSADYLPFMPYNISISQQQAVGLMKETGYALVCPEHNDIIQYANRYYTEIIPRNILSVNIPVMALNNQAEPDAGQLPDLVVEPEPRPVINIDENNKLFGQKRIVCYCTHSAESYIPDSGKAKTEGKRGLINKVAEKLVQAVADQGLQTEFVNTIHDYPEYDKSYTNSRATVNNILKDGPVLALFDIHRDSIPGQTRSSVAMINGKRAAPILIIVGTDERKSHPEWRKNLDFAQRLYNTSETLYPGLIKGIQTKAGTYNQEYHNHALLLEFGSDYNTLEEALYSASLFSEVLVKVLKEENS
jgi:stage II sporulation protein P